MAPSKKEDEENKRKEKLKMKLKKQKQVSIFGLKNYPVKQIQMKKVRKNQYKKLGEFVRVESGPVGKSGGVNHMCDDCMRQFNSPQGLGSHRINCEAAIANKAKDELTFQQDLQKNHDTTVFLQKHKSQEGNTGGTKRKPAEEKRNATRKDIRSEDRSCVVIRIDNEDDDEDDNHDEVAPGRKPIDKRKFNRGCAKRILRYSSRHKVDWVNEVDEAMNQDPDILGVTEYCREKLQCCEKEVMKLRNNYYNWSKHEVYRECLRDVLGLAKNKSGSFAKRSKA